VKIQRSRRQSDRWTLSFRAPHARADITSRSLPATGVVIELEDEADIRELVALSLRLLSESLHGTSHTMFLRQRKT